MTSEGHHRRFPGRSRFGRIPESGLGAACKPRPSVIIATMPWNATWAEPLGCRRRPQAMRAFELCSCSAFHKGGFDRFSDRFASGAGALQHKGRGGGEACPTPSTQVVSFCNLRSSLSAKAVPRMEWAGSSQGQFWAKGARHVFFLYPLSTWPLKGK